MDEEDFTASLHDHARAAAESSIKSLGDSLSTELLPDFLSTQLRVPTEIAFDDTGLEDQQFAEPVFQVRGDHRVCVLRVRSKYEQRPEALPIIAAYMAAAINYGASASPELCELYGSILTGQTPNEFYAEVCRIADL